MLVTISGKQLYRLVNPHSKSNLKTLVLKTTAKGLCARTALEFATIETTTDAIVTTSGATTIQRSLLLDVAKQLRQCESIELTAIGSIFCASTRSVRFELNASQLDVTDKAKAKQSKAKARFRVCPTELGQRLSQLEPHCTVSNGKPSIAWRISPGLLTIKSLTRQAWSTLEEPRVGAITANFGLCKRELDFLLKLLSDTSESDIEFRLYRDSLVIRGVDWTTTLTSELEHEAQSPVAITDCGVEVEASKLAGLINVVGKGNIELSVADNTLSLTGNATRASIPLHDSSALSVALNSTQALGMAQKCKGLRLKVAQSGYLTCGATTIFAGAI